MKLAFYSNYLNHHQVPIADELFSILHENFTFIATLPRDEKQLKGGVDYSGRSYCILAAETKSTSAKARELALEADVCIFGACSQEYAVLRAKCNPGGLSFEYAERWLKQGIKNIFSPVFIKWWLNYRRYYSKANFYKLCASAYAASDDRKLLAYKNKAFKWGYFIGVNDIDLNKRFSKEERVAKLMWCSRFLNWKHPELAVNLVKKLVDHNYNVTLDMFGDGEEYDSIKHMISDFFLENYISLKGNVTNEQVKEEMLNHDIFLFTSDRREGWGAVANEAMSCCCTLVGSDATGSVPYLVNDGENGLIFKSGSLESLYSQVIKLLNRRDYCQKLAIQGYYDMKNIWSPKNAANSIVKLIDDLKSNRDGTIDYGPGSIA